MTEYIKREDAIKTLGEEPYVWSDTDVEIAEHAQWVSDVKAIEAVPSADVVSREEYEGLELVCKNYEEALKDAVDELEESDRNEMAEWISVKDRLPSEAGRYLVAYKLFDSDLAWWNKVLSFSTDLYKMDNFDFSRKKYKGKSGFYELTECGYVENNRITHWMPLPENPKEIENG